MTDTAHHPVQGAPDQQAGGPGHEPLGEQEHPTHGEPVHAHGHDDSPEGIRKEVRRYLMVFGVLAVLTVVTVAISQLHLPTTQAIVLGLAVATIKASLVAAFFMHLITERKLIYAVLAFTFLFFGLMIWGPWHQRHNAQKVWPGYDLNASSPASKAPAETPAAPAH